MVLDTSALPAILLGEEEAPRLAYGRFGKGIGDPAVLNYGDCLAYGVAMALRQPLLFKGDAFSATDVTAVEY